MVETGTQKKLPHLDNLQLVDIADIKCSTKNGSILLILNERDTEGKRLAVTMTFEELSRALDSSGM